MTQPNLFDRIVALWKVDPNHPYSISQIAQQVEGNRREIAGALIVLQELGLLRATTLYKTRKEYQFNPDFNFLTFTRRIYSIIPHRIQKLHYQTYNEWCHAMEPLVRALIPPDRLQSYVATLYDATFHVLTSHVMKDASNAQNSPSLRDFEREYLLVQLEELLDYGGDKFGVPNVIEYFRGYLSQGAR